jgi:hypothetical protein
VNVRRVTAAVLVLATVGMLRILWLHFVSEPAHEPRRISIDQRYQALHRLVPAGEAGYVSDPPAAIHPGEGAATLGTRIYLQAQFALAPVILRYDDARAPVVIVNVTDPAKLPELLRQRGLELVAEAGPGLAVARPR